MSNSFPQWAPSLIPPGANLWAAAVGEMWPTEWQRMSWSVSFKIWGRSGHRDSSYSLSFFLWHLILLSALIPEFLSNWSFQGDTFTFTAFFTKHGFFIKFEKPIFWRFRLYLRHSFICSHYWDLPKKFWATRWEKVMPRTLRLQACMKERSPREERDSRDHKGGQVVKREVLLLLLDIWNIF